MNESKSGVEQALENAKRELGISSTPVEFTPDVNAVRVDIPWNETSDE